jgi:hypothetical protein
MRTDGTKDHLPSIRGRGVRDGRVWHRAVAKGSKVPRQPGARGIGVGSMERRGEAVTFKYRLGRFGIAPVWSRFLTFRVRTVDAVVGGRGLMEPRTRVVVIARGLPQKYVLVAVVEVAGRDGYVSRPVVSVLRSLLLTLPTLARSPRTPGLAGTNWRCCSAPDHEESGSRRRTAAFESCSRASGPDGEPRSSSCSRRRSSRGTDAASACGGGGNVGAASGDRPCPPMSER